MGMPCKGARIRLLSMPSDPDPIRVGQTGTVVHVEQHGTWQQISVDWDDGRTLMLSLPPDRIEIIDTTDSEQS